MPRWATAVLSVVLATMLPQDIATQGVESASVITAIRVVPLEHRAAVVVVLGDDIDQLAIAESTERGVFAVTFGPITQRLTPMTLESADPSRLVQEVNARERIRTDGARMVRVEVAAREPLRGSVRTSGRHLYLDVVAIGR